MTASRVLVTGAGGFVGRWAVDALLRRGYEVHAVSRRARPSEVGVVWHDADLLEDGASARLVSDVRPARLLHLAWVTEHGKYWESPENQRWADASIELLRRFEEARGERLVCAGTCAEYDWSAPCVSDGVCDERTTPVASRTRYAAAKHVVREWLVGHARVSWAWGRLFFVYGEGEAPQRLVPSVVRAVLSGEPLRVGPGSNARDFIYAADAGAALAAIADGAVDGPINVASGEATTIAHAVEVVQRVVGRRGEVAVGALPPRPGDPPRLVASVKRLRQEVGFEPSFDMDRAMRRTVAWWRQA